MEDWSAIAEKYHHFVDSPADKLRTELLYPLLWEQMAPMDQKQVLDIGCGNGFFAYHTAEKGAAVVAFDNQSMVSIAKHYFHHSRVNYTVQDANTPLPWPNQHFDYTLANLVLMDLENISPILKEVQRTIKPEGKIFISILHPCFTPPVGKFRRGLKGRLNKKHAYFHLLDYFGAPFKSSKQSFGKDTPPTTYYHRTLSEYAHQFQSHNLIIKDILEPKPSTAFLKKYPQFFHAQKISIFCVFVLQTTSQNSASL